MGGNALAIPPSPDGYQPPFASPVPHVREHCYTGKDMDMGMGIRYDCRRIPTMTAFLLGARLPCQGRDPSYMALGISNYF
jgi:hypothetical protein